MKKIFCLILAALLTCSLTGCFSILDKWIAPGRDTAFSDMEYNRPDIEALASAFQKAADAAQSEKSVGKLMDLIYDAYEAYYNFYTACGLAQIHFSSDMTSAYWSEENEFCTAAQSRADSLLDNLLYTLADSPLKDKLEGDRYFGKGFFDSYQGDSPWDETFQSLMEQDAALQLQYYDLSAQALACATYEEYYDVYATQMADVYVQMAALRREIARYAGYDSYADFAHDFIYGRDYGSAQATELLAAIQKELVPLYRQMASSDIWDTAYAYSAPEETFAYVKELSAAAGGQILEAFRLMEKQGLYDLTYSENKFDASFTVYLIDYEEPYIFVNPYLAARDKLTFTHEFGHFCNSFANFGNSGGVDVAEIFSQGLEYLSVSAMDVGALKNYKLADGLSVYVEQAAYAAFEEGVYAMEDPDREKIANLFSRVMQDYGMEIWDMQPLSFVSVTHFFTNPMYVLSYVVSNDAAFQLYQMELAEPGSGLKLYGDFLDASDVGLLGFLQRTGLQSPFAPERMASVRETFTQILQKEDGRPSSFLVQQ